MKKIPIQNHKKMAIRVALLRTLYVTGVLSMAILAPKTTRLLDYLDRGKAHRKELYSRIAAAKGRLKQQGLIRDNEGEIVLTEKGVRHIERILLLEYQIPEQIQWDGKWRMLLFDIREKRRKVRTQLRHLLEGVGFVRLQDSVWIYPYPCDEFVALIRTHLSSGVGELRSIVADALEADRPLREHFALD
ncbi:CRISPR-associated endonuclease Cas2 [Candidatus Kaiserbacteria bacterium RIFCSPHIGHO2_12_FULL_56_13]|uniref:CRISPR-associated endonuclease Cas2 n=2 Tax=Candidatus Kaiseribacteriota TaxID=1752734 RepID=A0A1F6E361_9BACT|nr:MAG: CRISPR-associated endonuclease Cas2 [Candidatus Kaiserbacteria bacterium RIFCSPHIGHO2_02_FULL_56_30]OGG71947.1 MAG: CRISPR-associated endonuclease Cas2 [Candidatus Kaiserbacteria bacterium RIFCSPHIGHO2_12_FULL_56_13]